MIGLLMCSALIAGSEIAFFSLSPLQTEEIKTISSKKNKLITSLLENPKYLLATILISNNFVIVSIVILSTYLTSELFDLHAHPVVTFISQVIIVTTLILLFGEILPKIYATQYPVRFANIMARPLLILKKLCFPLSLFLVRSTSLIDKRISKKGTGISRSDLSKAVDFTSDESTPEEEKNILKGIAKFGATEVREIMKSRVDVTAVDSKTKFPELIEIINDSGYSRIPVFEESFDNILGILYVKDLLPHLGKPTDFQWLFLIRPAIFVPEIKRINDLLKEFKVKKIHLAIVVDEYGGTSGIITLEDILEEIVGEISDEFDTESDMIIYKKLDDNNYLFEGKTLINDFCKILKIDDEIFDEVKGESESLAGLILEIVGRMPEKNEQVSFKEYRFKIISADKRRIKQIKLTIKR
ncbi:MAG: gliding motility-associated protein GldE [Bacteroidales bacterium]|nr:gliding motility-associated protein GldE [Bacteroidales bacterium]